MRNESPLLGSLEQEIAEMWFAVHVRSRNLDEAQWNLFNQAASSASSNIHLAHQWKRVIVYFTREVLFHLNCPYFYH